MFQDTCTAKAVRAARCAEVSWDKIYPPLCPRIDFVCQAPIQVPPSQRLFEGNLILMKVFEPLRADTSKFRMNGKPVIICFKLRKGIKEAFVYLFFY